MQVGWNFCGIFAAKVKVIILHYIISNLKGMAQGRQELTKVMSWFVITRTSSRSRKISKRICNRCIFQEHKLLCVRKKLKEKKDRY